ncbi:MAG: DUF5615 family PIN-like protein [Stellaceae bacterium]
MKFLIDAQLPPALALWLAEAGHDAAHLDQIGLLSASDEAIWVHALRSGPIVITKDEDFAARAAQVEIAPIIVWLRVGNSSNRALRAWFDARLSSIISLVAEGQRLIEVI